MKKYIFDEHEYSLEKNYKDCFNQEDVAAKITDYFYEFDYVFGDYAYDKLRLKGFYDKNNEKVSKINDIENLDKYIEDYCAYGAKWFLLKKSK